MATRAPNDGRDGRGRRRGLGWLAVLVALLVIGGIAVAIVASRDDGSTSDKVDSGIDAVTNAGDEALDTATEGGDDAVDTVTGSEAGDDALDTVTDGAGDAVDTATEGADDAADTVTGSDGDDASGGSSIVEDDPVVARLARGRELPFTAGPWARMSYRDTVYGRLRPATREHAQKIRQGAGYAIRFE